MKFACVVLILLCWPALARPVTAPEAFFNLPFAQVGERELLLDVYLPEPGEVPPSLLFWLHGAVVQLPLKIPEPTAIAHQLA